MNTSIPWSLNCAGNKFNWYSPRTYYLHDTVRSIPIFSTEYCETYLGVVIIQFEPSYSDHIGSAGLVRIALFFSLLLFPVWPSFLSASAVNFLLLYIVV